MVLMHDLVKTPTSRHSQELIALDLFIALLFLQQVFDVFIAFAGLHAEHELFNMSCGYHGFSCARKTLIVISL